MSLRIGIITCSDTRTEEQDTAGQAVSALSVEREWQVVSYRLCSDDRELIAAAIRRMADCDRADVILTLGGTGFGPRDVTPEATMDVAHRLAPGIAEYIRAESVRVTRRAMLSRGIAALRDTTLIINLPGSEKAAREGFEFVADQLEHAADMMAGGGHG